MKPREFWIVVPNYYSNTGEVYEEKQDTGILPDLTIHVREVMSIDWKKVWKSCDWRNLDEEDCNEIQELVEKQLRGEE